MNDDVEAAERLDRDALSAAVEVAIRRIAPLWPLRHFVAVNPFLGFREQTFHATCATMHRIARINMLMPRRYYRQSIEAGAIADVDLEAARDAAPPHWNAPTSLTALKAALARDTSDKRRHPAHIPTVAEVLDELAAGDRFASGTRFMIDEISKFCSAYFDEGQSIWRLPGRALPLYEAWRESARFDRSPELMGVRGFRALVADLPTDALGAIAEVVRRQGVPARAQADYLHQALLDVQGWAAHTRYRLWNAELYDRTDDAIVQLLAVRIVWGYTLFAQHTNDAFFEAWRTAMLRAARNPLDERLGDDSELCIDLIAHEALEHAYQRKLFDRLAASSQEPKSSERPTMQAAFCIDVRSEVFRRSLEVEYPQIETLGFAGFFGFPIEYIPIGQQRGGAQCPVLLTPAFTVRESVLGGTEDEKTTVLGLRLLRRRAAKAWKSFKTAAVSSFVFVEAAGFLFGPKIVSDALGLTRTVHEPATDGFDENVIERLGPEISPGMLDGRHTGFTTNERVDMAEAVLRAMSLTQRFAQLVLLAGHGSTTVNNPYASGLDCGACGGYTGEANARVAAAILNDPAVRAALRERGIDVPDDTWFLGALHDTTSDDVRLFDLSSAPATHRTLIADVRAALKRAASRARQKRAPFLGIAVDRATDRRVVARTRDWSQVRPEWALAGNAAFIAAPRRRTRGIDLDGRVFLHEYDTRRDDRFGVLELIMTAPMIVATWINLQYYGSTVNNRVFGSGNKTLHNVTGIIGVLEGNAGDLKVGLPWQSVHDGSRFVHEPLRLTVLIEAPRDAIDAVIAKHSTVHDLVANRWLNLFAMDDAGRVSHRWCGPGQWRAQTP